MLLKLLLITALGAAVAVPSAVFAWRHGYYEVGYRHGYVDHGWGYRHPYAWRGYGYHRFYDGTVGIVPVYAGNGYPAYGYGGYGAYGGCYVWEGYRWQWRC